MPAFLITYDLRKQRNYQPLYDLMGRWNAVRLLQSVWLADLNATAPTVRDFVRRCTDADDGVAVIELPPGIDWATYRAEPLGTAFLKRLSP